MCKKLQIISFLVIAMALLFTACPLPSGPTGDPTEDPTEDPNDPAVSPLSPEEVDAKWDEIMGLMKYDTSGATVDTWVFPDISLALSELNSLLSTNPEVGKAAALKSLLTLTTFFVDPDVQGLMDQFGVENYPTNLAQLPGYMKNVMFESFGGQLTTFLVQGQYDSNSDGIVSMEEQFLALIDNARSNALPAPALASLASALNNTLSGVNSTLANFVGSKSDDPEYAITISNDWFFETPADALNGGWPSMDESTPMDFVIGIPELQLLQAQLETLNAAVTMSLAYKIGVSSTAYQAYLNYLSDSLEQNLLPVEERNYDYYSHFAGIAGSPYNSESFALTSNGMEQLAKAKNSLISSAQKLNSAMTNLAARSTGGGDAYTIQPDSAFLTEISGFTTQNFTDMFTSYAIMGKKLSNSLTNPDVGFAAPEELFGASYIAGSDYDYDEQTDTEYLSWESFYTFTRGETELFSYYAVEANWPTAPTWATKTENYYDVDGNITSSSTTGFLNVPYVFPGKYFEAPFSGVAAVFELDVNMEPRFYVYDEETEVWSEDTGAFDPETSYFIRIPDASFGGVVNYANFVNPDMPEDAQYFVQEGDKIRVYSSAYPDSVGNSKTPVGEEFATSDRYESTGSFFLPPKPLPKRIVYAGFPSTTELNTLADYLAIKGSQGGEWGRFEALDTTNYTLTDAMALLEDKSVDSVIVPVGENVWSVTYNSGSNTTPEEQTVALPTSEVSGSYEFDLTVGHNYYDDTISGPGLSYSRPYFDGIMYSDPLGIDTLLSSNPADYQELPVQWDDLYSNLSATTITLVVPPESSPNYSYILSMYPNIGDSEWLSSMGISVEHADTARDTYNQASMADGKIAILNNYYQNQNPYFYNNFPLDWDDSWEYDYYKHLKNGSLEFSTFGKSMYYLTSAIEGYSGSVIHGLEE